MISETCLIPAPVQVTIKEPEARTGRPRAVGLISGGLDSTVATLIMCDLGVEVYALCFALPWGCCSKDEAAKVARKLGIKFLSLQLDESYLEVIRNPKYGRGRALNPCVDCRIHMFTKARRYMEQINADFVFTGEVLGQRPMSQLKRSLAIIEEQSGLSGRLLRPLSAQMLEPTLPEQKGLIDRNRLLNLVGRSRKEQMSRAEAAGIYDYPNSAGGCRLTEKIFSARMQDLFDHGYRNFREAITLKWGRHFRYSEYFKAIVGRDADENDWLRRFAHREDFILELPDRKGPTAILKGNNPDETLLKWAAGLVTHFSKKKGATQVFVEYRKVSDVSKTGHVLAAVLREEDITRWQI